MLIFRLVKFIPGDTSIHLWILKPMGGHHKQVIKRAMSLRPEERYQSVAEFKAALNAPPTQAHPVPMP